MKIILIILFTVSKIVGYSQSDSYLIRAGKLYDSETNTFLNNIDILVEGNLIAKIDKEIPVSDSIQILDLKNSTIVPGLIDIHTHFLLFQNMKDNIAIDAILSASEERVLRGAYIARTYLEAGFTTVRDVGNSGQYLDVYLQRAIDREYVVGPRMLVSGPIIGPVGGQFYQLPFHSEKEIVEGEYRVVKNLEDAKLAVKEHVNRSVNVIKILANGERLSLTLQEMKAIVEVAHQYGLDVTAHATYDEAIRIAVNAGVDGIEHGYYVSDSTLELMAQKNVYLVPTDPSVERIIKQYEVLGKSDYTIESIKEEIKILPDRLNRAINKGVMIVSGSDAYFDLGIPQGDAAKDVLIAYYESGISVTNVLKFATINGAKAIGMEGKIGILKEGAEADIVVFQGDLENNFKNSLFNVSYVIKGGKLIYKK